MVLGKLKLIQVVTCTDHSARLLLGLYSKNPKMNNKCSMEQIQLYLFMRASYLPSQQTANVDRTLPQLCSMLSQHHTNVASMLAEQVLMFGVCLCNVRLLFYLCLKIAWVIQHFMGGWNIL